MKIKDISFMTYLGIISILGFLTILVKSAFSVDISLWVESFLFMIIGFSLFVSGGYKLLFTYFKGGLTAGELNKIVSIVVGATSMVVGVLTTPIFGLEINVFSGIKVIISLVAILTISLGLLIPDGGCKK